MRRLERASLDNKALQRSMTSMASTMVQKHREERYGASTKLMWDGRLDQALFSHAAPTSITSSPVYPDAAWHIMVMMAWLVVLVVNPMECVFLEWRREGKEAARWAKLTQVTTPAHSRADEMRAPARHR